MAYDESGKTDEAKSKADSSECDLSASNGLKKPPC
jgi:hypothetical protein